MYMSGGIDGIALKVSNDIVPIIEQLQSNHEEAATHILLTRLYKADRICVNVFTILSIITTDCQHILLTMASIK